MCLLFLKIFRKFKQLGIGEAFDLEEGGDGWFSEISPGTRIFNSLHICYNGYLTIKIRQKIAEKCSAKLNSYFYHGQ